MMEEGAIAVLKIEDVLFASIQVPLHDKLAACFQQQILEKLEKTGAKGVIVDISAIDVVDSFITRVIVELGHMASFMGSKVVLVGIRPEIAMTIVELGLDLKNIYTALNLERGIALLRQMLLNSPNANQVKSSSSG